MEDVSVFFSSQNNKVNAFHPDCVNHTGILTSSGEDDRRACVCVIEIEREIERDRKSLPFSLSFQTKIHYSLLSTVATYARV